MDKIIKNNQVGIIGEIISDFRFSHEIFGEKFYLFDLKVQRLSGNCDILPVMVSERLIDINIDYKDMCVSVQGQFRSFNKIKDGKSHLILYVFSREIEFLNELLIDSNNNHVCLDGYIVKEPIYHKKPKEREIADLLLAVNRTYGKADYIPCICWGRNANFVSELSTGEHMKIQGRIQSRKYMKRLQDGNQEERIAYEVSVSKMEVLKEED